YYVGYSQFPNERLLKHNRQENFNTFTRKFRPWKIVTLFEVSEDKANVIAVERFIKRQKSRKFIEMLCDENHQLSGILAQLVRVPNLRD
ncbi:GIY-YIG nuclease family protein, partial [Chryseobacterium sp. CFS15]|uniref:GIY-YIG nuclease family protein n=1 Tax=Chryseobacterium sp. CFS15 TaxID=2986946 RepID=UPI002807D352